MTKSTGIGRGRNSGGPHNSTFTASRPRYNGKTSVYYQSGKWRCAASPTGAHYWKISSGKNPPSMCEYCAEVRSFAPMDVVPFNPVTAVAPSETAGELVCRVCGESKPEDQFHKKLIGRLDAECKACQTERKKRATQRQPEENPEGRRAAATAIARGLR